MLKHLIFNSIIMLLVCSRIGYAVEALPPDLQGSIDNEEVSVSDNEKWTGIDVSIVGKYAEKYGRPPRKPYINTDQGDLLLFVFTTAGVIAGFIIGYNFRKLFYDTDGDGADKNKEKNYMHNNNEVM